MTITSMAKQLNVSTMTIYRRCKKNGVNLDDLRDGDAELTAEGVAIIASMFDATDPQAAATEVTTQTQQAAEHEASQAIEAAIRAAELAATVEGLRAVIEQLQGERDDLRRQVAALTAALQAEQADRQQERRLLTGGPDGEVHRRHWWQVWRR